MEQALFETRGRRGRRGRIAGARNRHLVVSLALLAAQGCQSRHADKVSDGAADGAFEAATPDATAGAVDVASERVVPITPPADSTGGAGGGSGGSGGSGLAGSGAAAGGAAGGVGTGAGGTAGDNAAASGGMNAGGGGTGATAGAGGIGGTAGAGPVNQCLHPVEPSCFEPCGGDPYGIWVLEDSCFATARITKGSCETTVRGTPGKNALVIEILENGTFLVTGTETWSIDATMSLACRGLASADLCPSVAFNSDALLFSYTSAVACTAASCGECQCAAADVHGLTPFSLDMRPGRQVGNYLRSGPYTLPYCVKGDEMWIGGAALNDTPKVSYKFRKRSCLGTTTPCASRTAAQCDLGRGCGLGACLPLRPTQGSICGQWSEEVYCNMGPGCVWRPDVCVGVPQVTCDISDCGVQPGCTWGDPIVGCQGDSACGARSVANCAGADAHCAIETFCQATITDNSDCRQITNAVDCAKAPGCVPHPSSPTNPCTGRTPCSAQTDAAVCQELGCYASQICAGTTTPCADLPASQCAAMPGCYRSW